MDRETMGWFFLSLIAAENEGKSLEILKQLEIGEVMELKGKDLYDFGIAADLKEAADFDRLNNPALLQECWEEVQERDVRFISRADSDFPEGFLQLPDPPAGIYVRGKMAPEEMPKVSIVGSRRCTNYGKESAFFFGKELALSGVHIVSGMALGIDGHAERGAIAASDMLYGSGDRVPVTTAILGGGPDLCYPKSNIELYQNILDGGGCILSEKPPGYQARAYDFPRRNRLISALGTCLAVIEAAERSGTRTTVDFALSLGREVFAVPGRIGERMSGGCNELIKSGAQILTCPEDILQYLGLQVREDRKKPVRLVLSPEEKEIYSCIREDPVTVDDLLLRCNFPVSMLLEILVRLEIRGAIRKSPLSGYVRA